MTRFDDYPSDMSSQVPNQRHELDENTVEALLGARSCARAGQFGELATVLTELRRVVDRPAPAPSAALEAMLERGIAADADPVPEEQVNSSSMRRRLRRTLVVAGASSLISMPLMGVAAAHDQLPEAAQHVVAKVINATTPFTVPDPRPNSKTDGGGGQKQPPKKPRQRTPATQAPLPGESFLDPAEELLPDVEGLEENPDDMGELFPDDPGVITEPDDVLTPEPTLTTSFPSTSPSPTPTNDAQPTTEPETPAASTQPSPSAIAKPSDASAQTISGDGGASIDKEDEEPAG